MLVSSKLEEKDEELVKRAKRLSKLLAEKLPQEKKDTSGRLAYTTILRGLASKLGEQLRFKETLVEDLPDIVTLSLGAEIDRIIDNPDLLDILYESLATRGYRKKHGQFLTPPYIAEFMASWINQDEPSSVLDPAVGSGIFFDKIVETARSLPITLWGFDVDPILLNASQLRLRIRGLQSDLLHLIKQDFIQIGGFFTEKTDAIICNPPYLNFHDFDSDELAKIIEARYDIKLSRLTNIYVLFFMQSLSFAKNGAKLAFITPSEFLYTGYGEELKAFLLDHTTLDSLILIDFQSLVFNAALTTAVITLFRKGPPESRHKVRLIKIHKWPGTTELLRAVTEGREDPDKYQIVEVCQDELEPREKWLKYFVKIANADILEKLVPLSQLAEINRGIATGYNEYFLLNKSDIEKWKIENEFLVPVISKTVQCEGYDFSPEDWQRLMQNNGKTFLLHILGKPSANLQKYIEYGEKIEANQRYLTKHRSPWYSMEKREPAKILATVFHRKRMRFVLNGANVRNLAAFHCVYPKFEDTTMIKALLVYLNSDLCKEIQAIKRREYGGGLHKFEPKDLEKVPTLDVTRLSMSELQALASMFDGLCSAFRERKDETQLRKELDIFTKSILSRM